MRVFDVYSAQCNSATNALKCTLDLTNCKKGELVVQLLICNSVIHLALLGHVFFPVFPYFKYLSSSYEAQQTLCIQLTWDILASKNACGA